MVENSDATARVVEIIEGTGTAMLTHIDDEGRLVAKPMSTQQVEFDGTVRFIAPEDSAQVRGLRQRPQVNVSYSSDGAWVSLSGTARTSADDAELQSSGRVLIVVDADTAEYWDSPGEGKVGQLISLLKAKATGERDRGDKEILDL